VAEMMRRLGGLLSGWGCLGPLFVLIFIGMPLFGIANLVVLGSCVWRYERLRTEGVLIEGEVIRKDHEWHVRGPTVFTIRCHFSRSGRVVKPTPPKLADPLPGNPDVLKREMEQFKAETDRFIRDSLAGLEVYDTVVSKEVYESVSEGMIVPVTVIWEKPVIWTVGTVDRGRVWSVVAWQWIHLFLGLLFLGATGWAVIAWRKNSRRNKK
jgi:hypothetical protein